MVRSQQLVHHDRVDPAAVEPAQIAAASASAAGRIRAAVMAATIIAGVFQSERFFRETWPQISQALEPEAGARGAVRWIVGVTGLKPGARVLDSPCGFGRHAVALARLGYKVTGVDFNETELGRAREAAEAAGVVSDFVGGDMRDTDFGSEIDLGDNLDQSYHYL